jgi:hypothetical protein
MLQPGARPAVIESFPTKLTDVHFDLWYHSQADIQLLLDAVVAKCTLLCNLSCCYISWEQYHAVNLRSLTQLQSLSRLVFQPLGSAKLSEQQLHVLKQLHSLTCLEVNHGSWVVEELHTLLTPPHQLQQLTSIDVCQTRLPAAMLSELLQLPALTALHPSRVEAAALPMLPLFQNLTAFSLDLSGEEGSAEWRTVVSAALRACSALTDLTIHGRISRNSVDEQQLSVVLSALKLQSLQLRWTNLPSLSFLQQVPSLTLLKLDDIDPILPADVLFEVAPFLPNLKILKATDAVELSHEDQHRLQPPSALWPSLLSFSFLY